MTFFRLGTAAAQLDSGFGSSCFLFFGEEEGDSLKVAAVVKESSR